MGVSLEDFHAAIGLFNSNRFCLSIKIIISVIFLFNVAVVFTLLSGLIVLLLVSGSVHPNPGPTQRRLSLAHLNARSLNISDKLSEISAIASFHKYDLFAFSETWLNANISNDPILIQGFRTPLRKIVRILVEVVWLYMLLSICLLFVVRI